MAASYDASINLLVRGGTSLDRVTTRIEQLASQIQRINATPIDLSKTAGSGQSADRLGVLQRRVQQLRDDYLELGAAQKRWADGRRTGNAQDNVTINNLKAQADLLREIANNSKIASAQFKELTVASALASQKANEAGRERLAVLAEAFSTSGSRGRMTNVRGEASLQAVSNLISAGQTITRSEAAVSAYIQELSDLRALVPFVSDEFAALTEQISVFDTVLKNSTLRGQKSAVTPAAGPATKLDTVAAFEKRASYAQKVADLEYKQLVTGQQIVQAKLKETQQEDLQNRLAQASEALQRNELDLAKRLTTELRNQRIAYERANRAEEALMRPTSMVAGAAESVTGRRPGGLPPVPGSPAALAAAEVSAPTPRKTTEAIDQSISLQKRYNNLLTSAQIIEQKSLTYKAKGLEVDQQVATVQNLIQNIRENGATATKQYLDALDNILNSLRNELKLTKAVADARKVTTKTTASTGTGGTGTKKSAAGGAGFQNALIGGAFPLLFGGGPGAVIGGFAGGFIPGNPMMSIVTSAVGTLLDAFMAKTFELGNALNSTATIFDSLKEKSLVSNREREKEIQLLQDAGFAATANAVAQEELFKTIGANGVESLRQLGTESDRLNRTWAELSVQIQAVVAGPLADLAARLNDFFGPKAVAGRVSALREDLTPQRRAQLNKELIALGGPGSARFGAARKGLNEVEIELAARKFPEKVQALLDKYGPMRVGAEIKYDPKQVREQTVNILQKQLEVIDIAAKFKEAGEKQKELDRQRYDLVADYEENIAAIRRRIEEEITSKRLSLIQKENELLDIQAQIRQEGLSVANAQARRAAGEGLPTAARDVARQAAEAAGTFQEQELALAEQAAKLKRDSALEALRTDIQAAKFQADTAREVNKLNIDTAKRVADINASIRKQNASQDTRRFEIEKQLAVLKLQAIEQDFQLAKKYAALSGSESLLIDMGRAVLEVQAVLQEVRKAKPPSTLKQIGAVGGQGVSLEGIKQLNAQLKEAEANINAAKQAYNDLLQTKNIEEFKTRMQNIAEGIEAPLQALNEDLIANQATRTRYAELIEEGVRGVVAERIIEIEKLRDAAILQYDAVILELEKKREIGKVNEELERQIKLYKERRDAIEGKAQTAVDTVKKEESPAARLKEAITKAKEELNELTDLSNQVIAGAKAIGDAFQQAFKGLVSGAMTGQEALAAFFKGVGDHFLDMASQMIAKLIEIYILETVVGLISGAASGGFTSKSNAAGKATFGGSFKGTGSSTFGSGGIRVPGFAEGGFVTSPTRAMVGEGGEPEYVIPQSKMSAAMSRYSRGARGESVIPGNGTSGEGGATAAATTQPIDVRYTVERINNVDYVTADQFQRGMAQAAQQGASQGEQRALRKLQMSNSTRRRVGI